MTENVYAGDVGSVLSNAITTDGAVYVVNPTVESIQDLVGRLQDAEDPPAVRLLAEKETLKVAMADFVVGSRAADLVADGRLSIRWTEDGTGGPLMVSPDTVVSVVSVSDRVAGLTATDESFVGTAHDYYEAGWEAADRYELRQPPLSAVRETLATEISDVAAADFDRLLEALPAVRDEEDGLDEVTVCLLVAARHGVLLYDVSRWGEDVGLASKATFSRTKGELEDAGVVITEKVPIDVGRPRLRLRLATERLQGADLPDLARMAREMIAAAEEE